MSDRKLEAARREVFGGFVHTRLIEKVVSPIGTESLYPQIIRDDKLIFDPAIERRADGSIRIVEVSLIGRRTV